jgi:hypothetical protein
MTQAKPAMEEEWADTDEDVAFPENQNSKLGVRRRSVAPPCEHPLRQAVRSPLLNCQGPPLCEISGPEFLRLRDPLCLHEASDSISHRKTSGGIRDALELLRRQLLVYGQG